MPAEKTKFFRYDQNNSGGEIIIDENTDHYVIIEAHNVEESSKIADLIGLHNHWWCECCGPRFEGPWDDLMFGVHETLEDALKETHPSIFGDTCGVIIHYLDGRKQRLPHGGSTNPPDPA